MIATAETDRVVVVILVAVVMCQSEGRNFGSYVQSVEPVVSNRAPRNEAHKRLQQCPSRARDSRKYLLASGETAAASRGRSTRETKSKQAIWNSKAWGQGLRGYDEPDAQGSTIVMDCALLKKMNRELVSRNLTPRDIRRSPWGQRGRGVPDAG